MSGARARRAVGGLLSPVGARATPEVAERLVALGAEPDVQARIDYLAGRANEGGPPKAGRGVVGSIRAAWDERDRPPASTAA